MENRALLALVLSLLVFILWMAFLAKFRGPGNVPQESAETSAPSSAPSPQSGPSPSTNESTPPAVAPTIAVSEDTADSTKPLPSREEVVVTVRNKDYTYVFSSHGGVLKKILTEKYKDESGAPINLVPHNDQSMYPLTLTSGDPSLDALLRNRHFAPSTTSIQLESGSPKASLTFRLEDPSGLSVEREYRFEYENRLIETTTRISAPHLAASNPQFSVSWGPGLGGSAKSQTDYFAFAGPTTFVNNERMENPTDELTAKVTYQGDLKWTAFQNKYFAAALVPTEGIKSAFVKKMNGDDIYIGLNFESVQGAATASHRIYVGTKELEVLENSGDKLVRLIDYGWLGNKFAFLVKPMLKALNFFYGITSNYGWAIIFLTFLIKLILFPLTHKSFKSMKGMQKVQPYIKVIQERNKDDRQKMNEEMMDLYRKHKVNPLGGCLPMILQIPVFISLYHALFFSIELRGAPFMLWIQDLSKSDPYYVTPVLMGATMFLQQKLTPSTVVDPIQQKIFLMMPVVFTFLFITFPAGLVIYWTINNVLTIAQQYYIYHVAKD